MIKPTCKRTVSVRRSNIAGRPAARANKARPSVESMETRLVLSTFTVSNLNDAGAGSLRMAIADANGTAGADVINFSVSGTITLTTGALPAITGQVNIDGTTAPGFAGRPVVAVDYNNFAGLEFDTGSAGSALRSLALVDASGAGVTLNDRSNLIVGNTIGLGLDGSTVMANRGDGLVINPTSDHNVIGVTSTLVPGITTNAISVASNVISGNGGNGIAVHNSNGNLIVANYVGTDVTGTLNRGNLASGVVLDGGSSLNAIGGTITFNNSSGTVPDSNLISGNGGNGILLTGLNTGGNLIASNFVGTTVTGTAPLGNDHDGVAILDGANGNLVAGTTLGQAPFVFANVIGGNLGNGIRISNANNNTVHANYLGVGIDNKTPVGNVLDGILIAGTSANTQFGGVIPLGNVSAANGQNGVEIRDSASGTVVFNTFGGLAAFQDYTNLGNGNDGVLITSTGSGNVIRTNVLSNNRNNGLEITGNAQGVQVTEDIIGLNTGGKFAMPNGHNGIVIGGNAHDNVIGGFQPSVIPRSTISGNLGNGIAIIDNAHDNRILHTDVGTNVLGGTAVPNGGDGIYLGGNSYNTTIGGTDQVLAVLVSGNTGNGIELGAGTRGNTVTGNMIGTDRTGTVSLKNGGNGIYVAGSSNNVIGGLGTGSGNVIAFNTGAGVFISSGSSNAILGNSIASNAGSGIVLQPGANNNQAAPILTLIRRSRHQTTISGRLFSTPNSIFHLQFFASSVFSLLGIPQGHTYLGTLNVRTNARGIARIQFKTTTPNALAVYTSTATDMANNTSAFSNAIPGRFLKFASTR